MMQKEKMRNSLRMIFFVLAVMAVLVIFEILAGDPGPQIETEAYPFTESARELQNPNRGFYKIYKFMISDEQENYQSYISRMFQEDTDTKLAQIQICLQNYRQGPVSMEGLSNIDSLFQSLEMINKKLILRFTYDTEGQSMLYEPESLDIILLHMEQIGDILGKHSEQIFIIQGLFTGNWGEMNGTKYSSAEDMQRLAMQLANVTNPFTYLSVRMPAQWRAITQLEYPDEETFKEHSLAGRLGLYNDGMLGNESDYGTYRTEENAQWLAIPCRSRQEELMFQQELCCYAPNGGEVINDNPYNDFENAVQDLRTMRVTYLNRDYDLAVLDKWKRSVVTGEGCFSGMDGYSYIERHLGYRLVITDTALTFDKEKENVSASVTVKNVGFAPLYKDAKVRVVLYREEDENLSAYPIENTLRNLSGGEDETASLNWSVKAEELEAGSYEVYFSAVDSDTGNHILFANEENEMQYGYRIGTITVQ